MTDETEVAFLASTIVHARDDLLLSELTESEAVMLDIDKGSYFGVESVAKTIWDSISEPQSVAYVCQVVATSYETDGVDVETDTVDFLRQLHTAGLISVTQ